MLVTPCGLRASEVAKQSLDDIDGKHDAASFPEKPLLFRGTKVAGIRRFGRVRMPCCFPESSTMFSGN